MAAKGRRGVSVPAADHPEDRQRSVPGAGEHALGLRDLGVRLDRHDLALHD